MKLWRIKFECPKSRTYFLHDTPTIVRISLFSHFALFSLTATGFFPILCVRSQRESWTPLSAREDVIEITSVPPTVRISTHFDLFEPITAITRQTGQYSHSGILRTMRVINHASSLGTFSIRVTSPYTLAKHTRRNACL